ncbi:hypothetical protein F5884DRAFT_277306 [Xylogone sp. PMI_703]|nr:hypothetical protein F5884DRAFT_277306 [Xylogone sp. PMI_703]
MPRRTPSMIWIAWSAVLSVALPSSHQPQKPQGHTLHIHICTSTTLTSSPDAPRLTWRVAQAPQGPSVPHPFVTLPRHAMHF